ncbi:response regulator [Segetibacter sp.]|jgi:CheY-like chemotaxis protein|uniref:response regulator n=1 Tax=Segetibacter sp. TaxID=2231182 RepID=UPI002628EB98|nr:response regulator [Segetibacter sp.]MCW3078945.1 rcp1 2 [Segetibacter sp.]
MQDSRINILIADDDKDDALLLTEAILDILPSGQCTHVIDGIAALRHIKTSVEPDLVFLDLNMPLKNGINCLKDIFNLDLLPNTPIIIYSTSKNMKDIDDAYTYGASFYIVKPASFRELCKIIKLAITILGKPKSERVEKSNFVLREASLA